jgi:hypothetical protein
MCLLLCSFIHLLNYRVIFSIWIPSSISNIAAWKLSRITALFLFTYFHYELSRVYLRAVKSLEGNDLWCNMLVQFLNSQRHFLLEGGNEHCPPRRKEGLSDCKLFRAITLLIAYHCWDACFSGYCLLDIASEIWKLFRASLVRYCCRI